MRWRCFAAVLLSTTLSVRVPAAEDRLPALVRSAFPEELKVLAPEHRLLDGSLPPELVGFRVIASEGEERVVFAAYSDQTAGAARLLRIRDGNVEVLARHPRVLHVAGVGAPEVQTLDLSGDGQIEYLAIFADHRISKRTYIFAHRGNELVLLNPPFACETRWRDRADTGLLEVEPYDIDGDGVMELIDQQVGYVNPGDGGWDADMKSLRRIWRLGDKGYAFTGSAVTEGTYQRKTGEPKKEKFPFAASEGPAILHVLNHATPSKRVTSAQVWVNGQLVLSPGHFGRAVSTLQVPVRLNGGDNELAVRVAGEPGSSMYVYIVEEGADDKGCY